MKRHRFSTLPLAALVAATTSLAGAPAALGQGAVREIVAAAPAVSEIKVPGTGTGEPVLAGKAGAATADAAPVMASNTAAVETSVEDAKAREAEAHEARPTVVAAPSPPPVTLTAKVDLTKQKLTVIENGTAKYTWDISSGARGYETPKGLFQPSWMAKVWFSKQYDNAPMPNAVFFKNGAAIHATQSIGSLGNPASHGCVRLSPKHAATFYALVARHGLKQTRVHVFGTPRFAPEQVARRSRQNAPQVAYTRNYGGYGGYQGGYNGYGYYASGYSPFAYQPTVRVVQYNNRRYRGY